MIPIATNEDYEAVKEVLHKYLEGKKGDTAILKEAFTENALLNDGPIEGLYRSVERLGETEFKNRIDSIEIAGKVAVARVIIEDWHTYNYVEYQHLYKTNQGWKITSLVFTPFARTRRSSAPESSS